VSTEGYGHAATHLLALRRVRNAAETTLHQQAFSKIMLTHLPLCAPVMEAFPAELSLFHTDFITRFRHLEKQQHVAELH